jgi:hypothetical protein
MHHSRDEPELDRVAPLQECADRRDAERMRTIYRLVHVEHGDDEGLARCRNISDGGAALHSTKPMNLNEEITINFSPTVKVLGTVVWVRGDRSGVKYSHPIDSQHLLSRTSLETRAEGARPLRLTANLQGKVSFEDKVSDVTIHNVSQRCAWLTHASELLRDLKVRVALSAWLEREGIVKCINGTMAGIFFLDPLSVDDLGSAKRLQAGTAQPPQASQDR